MRKIAVAVSVLALTSGLRAADPSPSYRSSDDNTLMTFKGMQLEQKPNDVYRLIINGGIQILEKKENLSIVADHGEAFFASKFGKTALKSVHASKSVKITKRSDAKGNSRTISITSNEADYDANPAGPIADFHGSVVLNDLDSGNRTVVHATANRATAMFRKGSGQKRSAFSEARLIGSVIVNVDQAPIGKGKAGTLVARCSELTYTPNASQSVLKLNGNVQIDGTDGAISGTLRHVQNVTIHLNAKGEATGCDTGTAP
jgi:hypothetical protein